ncbi:2-isopropylmalate synthase/homocitrate synthase family protein [Rubidibacter lacunae KORDI 51-2]|uniref:Citramalate synthase n=1 Tax=Rubidibacter lacunae KORDI 51-2 TaxID=582515 RepID=U5DPB4_9CHRO|nr:citramalate synthase [Rubidibacter lacunae]ERN41540.1 2-isopropylmalate synthase/homocitrate synthase family protein [Rubidibacter lacunae KORDI 51-2]
MAADSSPRVWLYDTTLRDGAQREGIAFSIEDKIEIAHKLDALGIPFIEGGWPGANPKDVQFFWQLREEPLQQAEIVAFCSTRRPHKVAADDPMLQAILAAGTRWVTLFGKTWDLHVTEGLKTTLDENLAMIRDSIQYLRSQGRHVLYDAEHGFDGYKANPEYALQTLRAAQDAGADWLVLCDTNGGTLPQDIARIVREIVAELGRDLTAQIGIHAHNDSGTAVANSLAAVLEGAAMVQGTINGYGERCGNVDLCSVLPNLQIKLGYDCLPSDRLALLSTTSRAIAEIANLAPDDHAPFVGQSAFAHKGGIHVSAVERNPLTYEHVPPEAIGNQRRIVISEQAGISNIVAKARSFGIQLDKKDPACREILQTLKDLEHRGYQFEVADASFELLVRAALERRPERFQLMGFQVHCDMLRDEKTLLSDAIATIKVAVDGEHILESAEGNGPVSALDEALRKALVKFYPEIASFHLTDYKVRILDSTVGTEAVTRVLVESSDGARRWTTIGVSPNILSASYQAVVDGIEYGLLLQSSARSAASVG